MKTLKLQKGIIYGPMNSRRLGSSLGINLSPIAYKLCSFNCIYCQYGKTKVHTIDVIRYLSDLPIKQQVKNALEDWVKMGEKVDYITFSGNGEPTLHPEFDKIVDDVIKLRDSYLPQAKVAILSNSSNVSSPEVKKALKKLDLPIMKLDCGTKDTFQKISCPAKGIEYEKIVDDLKELKNIVIQSVFIGGEVTNTKPDEVEEWIERIRYILPKKIQIYSLDRPFNEKSISKVDRYVLSKIAELASELSGIEVEVY
jgi:wyosine [tRNA(Phe)-imidazoG37] synthetase (radical SAM superfamily)